MSENQDQDAGPELVPVFVTTGVRTSAGPGPGPRRVPPAEAAALVGRKLAVYGEAAPRGYLDGGQAPGDATRLLPR